jgi:xylulokinase
MTLFVGVDCGTQSTKCLALDVETGRVRAEARVPHEMIGGLPPGHQEQHPQSWIAALDRALRAIFAVVDSKRVRGIGVSGQQHGFVALDGRGRVLRPAKLWCDTSTTKECELLTRRIGGPAAARRKVGLPFLPGYTAPKVLWLKNHEPGNYRRLRHILLPHDFINWHLTGEYRMEFGDASGTALMDIRRRQWSSAAIAAVGDEIRDYLPALFPSDVPCGRLRRAMAERYGLSADVVVSAGGGDNMMAAIGTGNVAPGVVTASLGTSGTLFAYNRRPMVDPAGEIAAFCDSTGAWLPLLCTMNVTSVTEQFRALVGVDHRQVERLAAAVPPGCEGLTLLPYFAGERTPALPQAKGAVYGLTSRTATAAHLMRAAIEGTTLGLNYGLHRLRALGISPTEIRLTGGGAKSALWRQIAADIFEVPTVCLRTEEGAALGAAIQAAWCYERTFRPKAPLRSITDRLVCLDEKTRCAPDRRRTKSYREAYARHEALRSALLPLMSSIG